MHWLESPKRHILSSIERFGFAGTFCYGAFLFAMRSLVLLLAGLVANTGFIYGEIKTPENAPIEITSTGQTTYENGLATARDNVAIHIGNTDIYADYHNIIPPRTKLVRAQRQMPEHFAVSGDLPSRKIARGGH
jgi:hypothetical protein